MGCVGCLHAVELLRQFRTGGRTILGRITKRGSRYLRTLFVQAAKVIMMRPHRWSDFSFCP